MRITIVVVRRKINLNIRAKGSATMVPMNKVIDSLAGVR
jgi:hypothetical protein